MRLERRLQKTYLEKEKLLEQAISPFPTMFSTLPKTEIIIFVTFVVCRCFQFGLVQNFVVWVKKLLLRNYRLVFFTKLHRNVPYIENTVIEKSGLWSDTGTQAPLVNDCFHSWMKDCTNE